MYSSTISTLSMISILGFAGLGSAIQNDLSDQAPPSTPPDCGELSDSARQSANNFPAAPGTVTKPAGTWFTGPVAGENDGTSFPKTLYCQNKDALDQPAFQQLQSGLWCDGTKGPAGLHVNYHVVQTTASPETANQGDSDCQWGLANGGITAENMQKWNVNILCGCQ